MNVPCESQGILIQPCPLKECQYFAVKPEHDGRGVRKVRSWLYNCLLFKNLIDQHVQCIMLLTVSLALALPTQAFDDFEFYITRDRSCLKALLQQTEHGM